MISITKNGGLDGTTFFSVKSAETQELVSLQAEAPSRMRKTIFYRATRILGELWTVHRL